MTNTNAAMRAAILLLVVFTACEGHGPLSGRDTPDAGADGPVAGHDTPDATSERAEGRDTPDAGAEGPVGGHDTPDATSDHAEIPPETADSASERPETGSETADASRQPVPPPPDVCAPFHYQYTGAGGAGPDDCPTVDCKCGYVGPVPSSLHGCVQSADCAAVCASEYWLACAVSACASDADCARMGSGYCVVFPGATEGICQSGGAFSLCVDAGDCPAPQRCVAVNADGTRNCIDPAANDRGPCNQDADCPAGHCAFQGSTFVGVCTAGDAFASCFTDADCDPGLRCENSQGALAGLCSDGADNAPCERDADCQVGRCVQQSVCSVGNVYDFCDTNADCQSGFCAFGTRCTDGAVDAFCAQDDECASGRCAGNAAISACTTGAPSSKCVDDKNCVSGKCQHPAGMDATYNFGSCD